MYFKEEKILLAAIDHGFSSIKTPHFIFDNGVRKLGSATTLQENTLEYGNECYKTGEGRLPLKDDKTADKDFLLLTFAAIAKEAQYYGLTDGMELDVVVAAGLPFTLLIICIGEGRLFATKGRYTALTSWKCFYFHSVMRQWQISWENCRQTS